MTLPDPIERGESACEQWADNNLIGDIMTCFCGRQCKIDEAETLSPDPYAIPICPDCFNEAYPDLHDEDIECYRNVYKSVYGFNPRTYPETSSEMRQEMNRLNRAVEQDKEDNPEDWI